LYARGFSRKLVDRMVARGTLHEIYRGVYAVGHTAITTAARWKAATLAARPRQRVIVELDGYADGVLASDLGALLAS
jgi:hypothetical protein